MIVQSFSPEYLVSLVKKGERAPRRRQHQNIHVDYEDPCQRFFNAVGVDSYIRPHRHSLDPKDETLIAVMGVFALITFDDEGLIQAVVKFGSEKFAASLDVGVGVNISPDTWHTVVALVDGSVLLELKAGPFNPDAAKEAAPWAPEEQTAAGLDYHSMLMEQVISRSSW
ncbi:WbuC family cupin fold metalloprotein [Jeongeupia naejangsanensis]|uniref:WbuC family cupin fold metalloprotein n=1 Tax=Jeongeupia naejangsanensis TaxID=613195 RepID=A0ABS2BQX8_9NEIS|nr:WbuC family cupin fold metalloprotein [Jeongeupia naejangsanensis]MBM3117381.1 WbuC family cupin fold metalloprotein [Jeongeupia naejangsanensis]